MSVGTAGWAPRRGAGLPLLLLLLGACASVLGIEDRRRDSADNYPPDGYDGCRPGVSCSACLAVHQRECELRSICSARATEDSCAGCVCENCTESVVDCGRDSGCDAIWQCLEETRCELSGQSASSCVNACAAVIEAQGGAAGAAFRAAAEVRTCAVTSSCLSCLAPEPEPLASCSKANGCGSCADCFHQCLCSGEKFGACKELCGSEAPPETCTPDNSCEGCGTCFDLCTCGGASYEHCVSACQAVSEPGPVETCRPETNCIDCVDCSATCACNGRDENECATLCAPPAADDQCIQSSTSDGQTCAGCGGCLAQCACEGQPLEQCMSSCGALGCCGNCSGEMKKCVCEQRGGADSCGAESNDCDAASSCSVCACRSCPGAYALCRETSGCSDVFECMQATHCQGSACRERCGEVAAGGAALAFDAAEALWACHQGNHCACESPPPPVGSCPGADGDVACAAYESGDVLFAACCPDANATSACGLDLRRYFQGASPCEPFGQGNQHRLLLETCPARTIAEPPYNGAKLAGCCHAPDDTCGVFDDVTGLGCLRSTVFGIQAEGCGGLL